MFGFHHRNRGKMSQKSALLLKRKHSICVKLDQLKLESDSAISYIKKIFDEGRALVAELERTDQNIFLVRYPQVNKELDRLVNKVIQLNCCLELSASSEDETEEVGQREINRAIEDVTAGIMLPDENAAVGLMLPRENAAVGLMLPGENVAVDLMLPDENATVSQMLPVENAAAMLSINAKIVTEEFPAIQNSLFRHLIVPCDIQEGDILDMCYLHGDNPYNFWLRHYSTKALEEVIDILTFRFNGGHLRSCDNPRVGMYICICDGDGQQFFRAKVLQILKKQPVEILVINVDSGEFKEVKTKDIYYLDEDISSVRVQCINCCLQGNFADVSLWNDTVAKIFSQILRDSNLVVTVTAKIPGELSRFIVEVDCHNEGRIISKIELSKWLTSVVFPLLHEVKQNSCETEALMVLYRCLDPVHVEEESLVESQCNINSLGVSTDSNNKAAYEDTSTNETYTNLPQEHCQDKPDPLIRPESASSEISLKNVALKCKSLSLDDSDNTVASDNEGTEHDLQVCDPGPSSPMPLQLEKCKFSLFQRNIDFSDGQSYDAMIAHIQNPGEFYVHIVCTENTEIDNLGQQMNEFYERVNFPLETKSKAKEYIGSFCAAYNVNYKGWYRGQIVDWNEEDDKLISVKFVDYGDVHLISLEAIQPLRQKFTESPIFTQCCHLAKIHPINSFPGKLLKSWPIEAVNLFKCLVDMNTLYTVVVEEDINKNANSLSILLCDNRNETCINKSIVEYGYAVNFSPFQGPLDSVFHKRSDETENIQTDVALNNEVVPVSGAVATNSAPSGDSKLVEVLDRWDPMSEDFYSETNNLYHDDEDATFAVTGYKPQDEKRICKLFAKTGKCFKGPTCFKEHSFMHQDGWTTDKENVFHEAFNTLILPREGSEITLEVTEIVNANTFWAILLDDTANEAKNDNDNEDDNGQQEETLLTLNDYLNRECNVKELKRLQILPALGQVVVAQYSDGRYYRARVVDLGDNCVLVTYVDYGNKDWVSLSNIRDVEQKYLHLPFQAIECVVANVERLSDVEGGDVFHRLLRGTKDVRAKVINSYDHAARMEVLVMNSEGYDIGSVIIESGHGKPAVYGTMHRKVDILNG